MKYFLDTEFLEGKQDRRLLGIKIGETKPTIDMISIGIVAEDRRKYYAVSRDFNLKEAWNRYDLVQQSGDMKNHFPNGKKVYWIRENVLKPIYYEFIGKDINFHNYDQMFTYKNFARLLRNKGKSNVEIAEEIKDFIYITSQINNPDLIENWNEIKHKFPVEFYAYFADYDWVVFCWLFGKMMDLPKGFPMYCNDLKQILDDKVKIFCWEEIKDTSFESALQRLKNHPNYPQQENEHNALADAKWNKKLYEFLKSL